MHRWRCGCSAGGRYPFPIIGELNNGAFYCWFSYRVFGYLILASVPLGVAEVLAARALWRGERRGAVQLIWLCPLEIAMRADGVGCIDGCARAGCGCSRRRGCLCCSAARAGAVGQHRIVKRARTTGSGVVLLPKPVVGRGADGVVPGGVGRCRTASDSAQQRPPTSKFLRLCWSAACVVDIHTGELHEQRRTTLKSTFAQLNSAEQRERFTYFAPRPLPCFRSALPIAEDGMTATRRRQWSPRSTGTARKFLAVRHAGPGRARPRGDGNVLQAAFGPADLIKVGDDVGVPDPAESSDHDAVQQAGLDQVVDRCPAYF